MIKELYFHYRQKWWFWLGVFVFIVSCVIVSWIKADKIFSSGVDYAVLFTSGQHFSEGKPLYGNIYKWVMPFYYLPVMAMFFSTLSLIYYKYSTFFYFLINILLSPVIYILILRILELCGYSWKKIRIPFIFSVILSLRYIGTNYDLGQVNVFVLLFVLLGFVSYLKNKENQTLIFFSIAAIIKVIPVVFLFWYFLKKPSLKVIYLPLMIFLLALIMPIPFRGFEQSINDLHNFYIHVLQRHLLSSEVFYRYTNQSLSAFMARLFFPPVGENFHSFPFLNLSYNCGHLIILFTRLALLASFIYLIIKMSQRKIKDHLTEFSIVILFIFLFSSLTWKNHLVSMVVVFIPFFIDFIPRKSPLSRTVLMIVIIYLLFLSINYASVVGAAFSDFVGSYSMYFFMVLFFYIYYYQSVLKQLSVKTFTIGTDKE